MRQRWRDLASLHWAVDPDVVAPYLPPGTRPDCLDGATYVGLLPFRMVGAGVGTGPAVPWLGSFLETNVRLYSVDATGRRGVVFRSLDTDRLAVVLGARGVFGLPYRWARMSYAARDRTHVYDAAVRRPGAPRSRIVLRDLGRLANDDEAAIFVSARWGLHVARAGRTWFVPNSHERWPLHRAALVELEDGLVAAAGFPASSTASPTSSSSAPA